MDAKINYPDLNALLAKQCNINLSKSENFTRHFFNIIIEGLQKDGKIDSMTYSEHGPHGSGDNSFLAKLFK